MKINFKNWSASVKRKAIALSQTLVKRMHILQGKMHDRLKPARMKVISTDFRHIGMALMAYASVGIYQYQGTFYNFVSLLILFGLGIILWVAGVYLTGD
ncbi:hypothetical protein [Acinetobacter sp.]|uniref:hypothetical protein n=1 Tax=Acinetobacter sp. TaxID=472 RepID=UPI003D070EDE